MSGRFGRYRHEPPTTARSGEWTVHDERGGIITGWLIQLVVTMAVVGLVAYELISIAVTSVNLDDDAREVAQAAQEAYRSQDNLDEATATAAQQADELGVTLEALRIEGDFLVVEVSDEAPTLVTQHIGPLKDYTRPHAERQIRWQP